MAIISLLTDFGLTDNFVGVMKAVILGINPHVRIVDICHEARPEDILGAAFLLKGSFKYFPDGSIHLVVVDPGVGSKRKIIIAKTKNYFFVGPDNGVLSLALKEEAPLEIIEVTNNKYFLEPTSSTFHGRDIFAPVAAYLSKSVSIDKFGSPIKAIKKIELPKIKIHADSLTGEIIYIDRFGNLVSNIDKEALLGFIKNKKYEFSIRDKKIEKISKGYFALGSLKPGALIDSFGYLELAVNRASAKAHLGANIGDKIIIRHPIKRNK